MTGSGLFVDDITVEYGPVRALTNVTVEVPPSGFVAVLGANGAGKTTLVRSVTGLLSLHRGRVRGGVVRLDGRVITGKRSTVIVKAGVAQVPEGRKLFPRLTVEENLRCGAATRKDKDGIEQTLEEVWELFPQIEKLRRQSAGLLSGGEQQMVAVGRALMSDPRVLVCDELSLGLAPMIVGQLFELLNEVNAARDVAILVIEQNARLALQHSKYAYVLELGEIVHEGESQVLRDDPHIQDLYLGGEGEAREAYEAIPRHGARDG